MLLRFPLVPLGYFVSNSGTRHDPCTQNQPLIVGAGNNLQLVVNHNETKTIRRGTRVQILPAKSINTMNLTNMRVYHRVENQYRLIPHHKIRTRPLSGGGVGKLLVRPKVAHFAHCKPPWVDSRQMMIKSQETWLGGLAMMCSGYWLCYSPFLYTDTSEC